MDEDEKAPAIPEGFNLYEVHTEGSIFVVAQSEYAAVREAETLGTELIDNLDHHARKMDLSNDKVRDQIRRQEKGYIPWGDGGSDATLQDIAEWADAKAGVAYVDANQGKLFKDPPPDV